MIHQAIYATHPNVVTIRGDLAYDANEQVVEYDMTVVQAYIDANAYKSKRAAEYPSLAEFADAYYWAQNGDDTKMTAYLEKCEAVKTKYPKGE